MFLYFVLCPCSWARIGPSVLRLKRDFVTRNLEVKLVGLACCVNLGMAGTPFPRTTSMCSSRLELSKIKSLDENWKAEARIHDF